MYIECVSLFKKKPQNHYCVQSDWTILKIVKEIVHSNMYKNRPVNTTSNLVRSKYVCFCGCHQCSVCVWRFCLVIKQLLMWTRGLSTCSIINSVAKRLPCFGESEVLPQYGDLVFRSQRMVSELTISFCVHIHVSQC